MSEDTSPLRDPQLELKFPKLRHGGYSIESPQDGKYNCVAFAVGNPTRNWQWMPYKTGGYYWPPGVDGDDTIEAWTKVFSIHGYRQCETGDFEKELEKIALYTDADGVPTHVAKQDIARQKWISKLGKGHDIHHDSYEVLEGFDEDEYGVAVRFMARPRILPKQSLWYRFRELVKSLLKSQRRPMLFGGTSVPIH